MIYVLVVLYGIVAGFFIYKKNLKLSQAVISLLAFAIVSSVALGQNYTTSLIAEVNDGIGISNFLARLLLPNENWTVGLFLSRFELYLGISIALIFCYFISVIVENKKLKGKL